MDDVDLRSEADGPRHRHWLVVGVDGQVGGALLRHIGGSLAAGKVTGTVRGRVAGYPLVDLARVAVDPGEARALLAALRPDVVVVAAGMTNVDGCELDPAGAGAVNRDGPAALALLAHEIGARTVYYSTEYVFDGRDGPYDEASSPAPLSVYGASKLAGEDAVLRADPGAVVIRTTVVYGPERLGKNFAYRLAATLGAGEELSVAFDQVSTPTYNRDLAAATVDLVTRGVAGVVHVAGPERVDRAAFAKSLAASAGLDPGLVRPVSTATLGQRARRPLDAGLVSARLSAGAPGPRMRPVPAAVADWRSRPDGRNWPGP